RGPDLAEGEARLFERRLQLVDGEVSLLGSHHPVDPVEAGGVPLVGEAGGLMDERFADLELAAEVAEEGLEPSPSEVVEEGSSDEKEALAFRPEVLAGDGD